MKGERASHCGLLVVAIQGFSPLSVRFTGDHRHEQDVE
jgi:hypothetical protein